MEKTGDKPAIAELNRLAGECFRLRQEGNGCEFQSKLTRLFHDFCGLVQGRFPDELICDIFTYQWGYKCDSRKQLVQTDGWTPEQPFYQATVCLLKLRAADKPQETKSLDDEENPIDIADSSERPDEQLEQHDAVAERFRQFNAALPVPERISPKKPRYMTYFYTELVAEMLYSRIAELRNIPEQTEGRMDMAFADSFLKPEIQALPDIEGAELKSLQCFTGAERDAEKPCGYKLHTEVFRRYIESVTGKKAPGASAISQQREKFTALLREVVGG